MQYQYDQRLNFVTNLCRLSLWYLFQRTVTGDNFRTVLNSQTPLYRLTIFWNKTDHPANDKFDWEHSPWGNVVADLLNLYHNNRSNPAGFEQKGFELLEPALLGRIEQDIAEWPWLPSGYVPYSLPQDNIFGIFAFDPVKNNSSDTISFHIGNACMPNSPLKDLKARSQELLRMINAIEQRYPNITAIKCNSWLNAFPPFLKLFPNNYPQKNSNKLSPGYGYNWWGQFMSRAGSFHQKNGKYFRQTGTFPFIPCNGYCKLLE